MDDVKSAGRRPKPKALVVGPQVPNLARGVGRIPVTKVEPVIEGGAFPAKATVGELFPITARVFREGHDAVNANIVLTSPHGRETSQPMVQIWPEGLDIWQAQVRLDEPGAWTFRVEGWSDRWATWLHDAGLKLAAGQDFDLVRADGLDLLQRSIIARVGKRGVGQWRSWVPRLEAAEAPADLQAIVDDPDFRDLTRQFPLRELVSPTAEFPLWVDRSAALFSAWYELFPRSQGAQRDADGHWVSGTFATAAKRLPHLAELGFSVVYLPPIHPIGQAYRKGPNNTLQAEEGDPGSPWAIGDASGGHDAIHTDLGSLADFRRFVSQANGLGLEVAIDFALQASPDHPWLADHPEWFNHRLDGTIAYAENPPKKYQDIYPLNFDHDPDGLYRETERLLDFWIDQGVTIFRVDNPHTKPVEYWAWLMAEMRQRHPEVLFLAEAFTRPEMMQTLGKVGFHQGYSYFVWREQKWEIEQYLTELSQETAAFYRPNFFVNTPDINPYYLQSGNPAAFVIRLILATMLSPSWGMYSGYELFEHEPLPGREEYAHSEKYEYRPRDYHAQPNLNVLIAALNHIRRDHPALQQLRQIHFHATTNDQIMAWSKTDGTDRIIVVISLDPDQAQTAGVHLDLAALGLPEDASFQVRELLTGAQWTWQADDYVNLYPAQPAHILSVESDTV